MDLPLLFAGHFGDVAEIFAVGLFKYDNLFPFGGKRADAPFPVLGEEDALTVQVEVLIRTEGRFFAVFQVVFAGGVFKHEISRSVRNPVVSLTGYRLSFRVEQSPFDRVVGFLSSELCDQITVFGFSLNVERSGQRGFGTGGFDPYQRSVFGRVGYEVFRSGNRRFNGFEPVAAHCQQAGETCEYELFHK